ncbi:siroheme synthase CysG [Amaricoccus tamworthensis]|uniref:siroheme synthase CysG n=1 Tax=Amaricoccus tamworthensis TaxID=57002 RepID=UPI003C7A55DB
MRHFPVFLDLRGRTVAVCGAGEVAVAKLRLLLRTEAEIVVYGTGAVDVVRAWARDGRITLVERAPVSGDFNGAALVYAADADEALDERTSHLAKEAGVLLNVVDNLEASEFITPAIVDRDPVTVAIGTEGAAPVLARGIKAKVEEMLPSSLGRLTRIGQGFRGRVEDLSSKARRAFWSKFYFGTGPQAFEKGEDAARDELERLLAEGVEKATGIVRFVGAGPGDPELLTLKARRMLHEADVVIHDRLVSPAILELARREALVIEVGKKGFGQSWKQEDINDLLVAHGRTGADVVRLKGGDPSIFGRLDEEIRVVSEAGIAFSVVPGITSSSAAAASVGRSLTRRGRNSDFRVLTGHDVNGFAAHDWRALAAEGSTAAVYMGVRSSEFLRGRLMMHGAAPDVPVTAVENASRPDQRIISTTLLELPDALRAAEPQGPVMLLLGIEPHAAPEAISQAREAL